MSEKTPTAPPADPVVDAPAAPARTSHDDATPVPREPSVGRTFVHDDGTVVTYAGNVPVGIVRSKRWTEKKDEPVDVEKTPGS